MTKDRVIFKLIPGTDNEVIAFLPDDPVNFGTVGSYMHVGQHSEASLPFYWSCKPARPEQYQELLAELISIGYDPVIRQRITHRKEEK